MESKHAITQLLENAQNGDAECQSQLMAAVYDELRRLAAGKLRHERRDHTLQPSALVNEAYLRLVASDTPWKNRTHFFSGAAGIMRNILVDHARKRKAQRRTGGQRVELSANSASASINLDQVVLLDTALRALTALNERHGQVVEMHFFGGLTFAEVGEVAGISEKSAKRAWDMARAWLQDYMKGIGDDAV